MNEINAALYRKLESGKQFDKLIPKPPGNIEYSGTGNTSFSMKEIAAMVEMFANQMQKVAKVLQTSSLKSSVENVKDFVYSHFQYKADNDDQLLRSPSYAWWFDRQSGIDCKSYSIIASSLLSEMGIKHYIRRIKQPTYAPTEWTHVYVVVPFDQKNGDLSKGYYTVDGTLPDNYEPAHIETNDLFMSLKHYRLNAPAPALKGISLNEIGSVKNLFNSIDCIGGTTYNKDFVNKILNAMNLYFNNLVVEINQSIAEKNQQSFSESIAEYFVIAPLGLKAAQKKLSERDWNSCSQSGLKTIIKAWEFFNGVGKTALTVWLDDNFTKDLMLNGGTLTIPSSSLFEDYGMGGTSSGLTNSDTISYYFPKSKAIKAFEFTPYTQTATASNFNPIQFLQGLSTIAASFDNAPGTSPTNPNSNTNIIGGGNTPQANQAGFGIIGWVVLAAGVGLLMNGFTKTKSTGAGAKTVSKSTVRKSNASKLKRNVTK